MNNSGSQKARLHPIISDRPSVNFFQGALLGNGALGSVVCVRPDAIFQTLRAVGAFLVSGEKKSGVITDINIFSETGGTCRLYSPWPSSEVMIVHQEGSIPFNTEKDVITFDTIQGGTYQISHKTNPNPSQVR